MSTRCTIHFHDSGEDEAAAIIYRHSDGYPEGILPDLDRFFAAVEEQTRDTRFNDATYLAAKFVVWQAGVYTDGYHEPLDFLSIGVVQDDPGDIEYRYHVRPNSGHRPTVDYEEV